MMCNILNNGSKIRSLTFIQKISEWPLCCDLLISGEQQITDRIKTSALMKLTFRVEEYKRTK